MAKKDSGVLNVNLGIYLDRGALSIPKRGLKDCLNVRVKDGRIVRDNMGYGPFPDATNAIVLGANVAGVFTPDPVTGIDNFFKRDGVQHLLFASTRDIYEYIDATKVVRFLTRRHETGTVDVTNASAVVTGTGTLWLANLKPGDFFHAGASGQRDPQAKWYEIASVDSDTQITLTVNYAEATQAGIDYTARLVFTGDLKDAWSFESFPAAEAVSQGADGDRWYATNGIDKVIAWDGADTQVYRPALGNLEAVKFLVRYKNMLVYGNITVTGQLRPFSARNSAIGQPENVATLEASEFVVHDGVDSLLAALPLGDTLVFYGERSITLSQFVGGDFQFIQRTAISGIGPLSGRAVADFGDFHEFLGPDAQYRFDGITTTEIGFQVWRDIIRRQSPQRRDLINAHFDEENGELLWIMPINTDADSESGPPEKAFVEHYLELVGEDDPTPFTVREIPATATGFFSREVTLTWDQMVGTWQEQNFRWNDQFLQGAFPFNLFGTNTGDIFILSSQDSANGASIKSFARFGRRPLGDIRRKGTVLRVYAFAEQLPAATYDLDVTLHLANDPAGPTTPAGPFGYDLTQSTSKHFVSPRKTGRYVEVEFGTEGVGKPFFLEGHDMDVVPAGER